MKMEARGPDVWGGWSPTDDVTKLAEIKREFDELVALLRWARAGDDKEKNLHGYVWRDRVDGLLAKIDAVSSPDGTTNTQLSKQTE